MKTCKICRGERVIYDNNYNLITCPACNGLGHNIKRSKKPIKKSNNTILDSGYHDE